jgi:hypothetical protein
MGKSIPLLCLFTSLILFFVVPSICKANPGGHWELVDVKSGEAKNHKERCSEERITIGEGTFSFYKRYFQGVCNTRKEATFSATATWARPPKRLNPGEVQNIRLDAKRGSNIPALFLHCGISISIDKPDCRCGIVCGGQSMGSAKADSRDKSDSVTKTVKFKVPSGSKGASFALRFCPFASCYHGQPGFRYIYKWIDGGTVTTKGTPKSGVPLKWKNPSEYEARNKIILTVGPGSRCIFEKKGGDTFVLEEGDRAIVDIQDIMKTPMRVGSRVFGGTRCQIKFPDGSVFNIKYGSEVRMVSGGLKLKFGETMFNLRKEGRRGWRIVTPISILGVMGTAGLISVADDGTTTVRLFEGKVSVTNQKGLGSVILGPAQMTICRPGSKPTPPQPFDIHSVEPWWEGQGQNKKSNDSPSEEQTGDKGEWQSIGQKSTQPNGSQTAPSVRDEGVPKGHTTKYGF